MNNQKDLILLIKEALLSDNKHDYNAIRDLLIKSYGYDRFFEMQTQAFLLLNNIGE